jgi:DDE domain
MVEPDHRFIKRRVKPGLGFFCLETAWRTLQGYEVMHMIRKGQMRGVEKGDSMGQRAFIARLFGGAASAEQKGGLHAHRIPPGFFATQPTFTLLTSNSIRNPTRGIFRAEKYCKVT